MFCSTKQFPMNHEQEEESFTDSAVITAKTVRSVRGRSSPASDDLTAVLKKGRKSTYSYTHPALQRAVNLEALKPVNHEIVLLVSKVTPLSSDMLATWARRATIASGKAEVREKDGETSVYVLQQYNVGDLVTSVGGSPGEVRELSSYCPPQLLRNAVYVSGEGVTWAFLGLPHLMQDLRLDQSTPAQACVTAEMLPAVRDNEQALLYTATEAKIKKHTHLVAAAEAVIRYSGVGVWARQCDDTVAANTRWVVRLRGHDLPPVAYLVATSVLMTGSELVTPRTSILRPHLA